MDDSDRLSALRRELAQRLGSQRYELWIGPHTLFEYTAIESTGFESKGFKSMALKSTADCENVAGELRVGCPSQFECQWLRSRLHAPLLASCRKILGDGVTIKYSVVQQTEGVVQQTEGVARQTEGGNQQAEQADSEAAALDTVGLPRVGSAPPVARSVSVSRSRVSRRPAAKSTFANYVVGPSNELASRTAQLVVEQPGQYGPLLLFGPPGVGKTHLCYAMLRQLRQHSSRVSAVRLTAEQFTGEFLASLDQRSLPSFRQKYRSIDVLFVDDIQFLVGKRATLDELLHTIDTLHERGRQVVFTCDRSPGELQKVSAELVSRISGGLSIPLNSPDFATRIGIVRQLAVRLQVSLEEEVIRLIATQVAGSARQLAGAINRLVATSMALESAITLDLARTTLVEFVQQNAPSVRLADIQRAVCEVFGVEAASLKSDRKARSVAEPRMLAMWLARKYTRAALGEIGEYFGRRSHSTVVSAQKKIERLVSENAEISVADRPCQVDEAIRQVEAVLRTA